MKQLASFINELNCSPESLQPTRLPRPPLASIAKPNYHLITACLLNFALIPLIYRLNFNPQLVLLFSLLPVKASSSRIKAKEASAICQCAASVVRTKASREIWPRKNDQRCRLNPNVSVVGVLVVMLLDDKTENLIYHSCPRNIFIEATDWYIF